jgi:hypothetical protein
MVWLLALPEAGLTPTGADGWDPPAFGAVIVPLPESWAVQFSVNVFCRRS